MSLKLDICDLHICHVCFPTFWLLTLTPMFFFVFCCCCFFLGGGEGMITENLKIASDPLLTTDNISKVHQAREFGMDS